MRDKVDIVGIGIDNITMDEGCEIMLEFLESNRFNKVYTPNSEILYNSVKDKELENILNNADLVIPDGIGVVIASKFYGTPLKERVPGIDLMGRLIELAHKNNKKIYMLGAGQDVIETAAAKLEEKYPGLNIAGIRNGYFTNDEVDEIIGDINEKQTDILLVGLGSPKQEQFIHNNRHKIKAKIAIGVGGSFDITAGKIKRAPEAMQKLGLEWLYRFLKQPSRIGRVLKLPKFVLLALYDSKTRFEK